MSIRAIELFYLEVKSNPTLRKELQNIKLQYVKESLSPLNAEEFIENGLIPLARKYDMVFSLDDLMDYASKEHAEMLDKQKQLMSEDDLSAVSGGVDICTVARIFFNI